MFYTGTNQQYLCLVVLTEEEKRSVLHECHDHPGTGNHGGLRATRDKDERTNQNVKRALRRYVNESHDHWDIHLPAVVYGINTTSQASTKYTPFFLMFHRHPRFPEVMNACPIGDSWEVADPEEDMDTTVDKIRLLNEKVLQNIELAQERQKKSYAMRKKKSV
ncbi:uncharacterized protein ACB058_010653 [Synchiropus picturatus]